MRRRPGRHRAGVSFDDWAVRTGLRRLDLVKIDVEGAEAAVLANELFRPE